VSDELVLGIINDVSMHVPLWRQGCDTHELTTEKQRNCISIDVTLIPRAPRNDTDDSFVREWTFDYMSYSLPLLGINHNLAHTKYG
jgi:hypothetical protein